MFQTDSPNHYPVSKFPQYFWVLFVVLSVAFSILFLDHFRVYVSQMTLLVKHKSEQSAILADETLDNLRVLPETVAFYDQLLSRFPEIRDPWAGMSQDKRQELWAEHVRVERHSESGFVTLSVTADTSGDAALLSRKVALNLIQSMGRYYDIRTDAEVYISNGPVTSTEMYNPFGWLMLSVGLGFVAALAIASGAEKIFRGIDARTSGISGNKVSQKIQSLLTPTNDYFEVARSQMAGHPIPSVVKADLPSEKKETVAPVAVEQPAKEAETARVEAVSSQKEVVPQLEKKSVEAKAPALGSGRMRPSPPSAVSKPLVQTAPVKASTPRNLPFLEEGMSLEQYLFQNTTPEAVVEREDSEEKGTASVAASEEVALEAVNAEDDSRREPTAEELKRRLNQLLRGEL